jgi:hypothetical protein
MTSFSPLEAIPSSFKWPDNRRAGHEDSDTRENYFRHSIFRKFS